ncbi:Ldh family oxidoreductase [Candidatus Pantoea multigeneris]|uniref:Ldh family oxidoreductase n=1 Tax=Candidatus Pantoea multigeneris TaxID=2608357 RepID=A0ABX0RGI8_9GAMM|nr:Ldh family oxidoreductase [Pantoea multigeneris]NIF22360.1 Ldh family oxidoreductase [Pantoea multigeneris]
MSQPSPARYSAEELQHWISQLYQAAGARECDALNTARVLVRTSLRGIDTHGVTRVLIYLEKMQQGEVNPQPDFQCEVRDNVIWFDGDGGLGQSVATEAFTAAVELAQSRPVVTLLLRKSGHLAALGQFALEAAEQGMIAVICQETPPLMALEGSKKPAIGNNPVAFAAPVAGQAPLVFDMATSVVARGNVLQAIKEGRESIPDDWAIGPDGKKTQNPQEAFNGAMLPIAGHKGIGLAMLVQVLAGSLTGSATAASAAQHSSTSSAGNVSAFVLVINPALLLGREAFDQHMLSWLETYLTASGDNARYPGQRAAQCEAERKANGIPVSASVLGELKKAGDLVGLPFDLQPLS